MARCELVFRLCGLDNSLAAFISRWRCASKTPIISLTAPTRCLNGPRDSNFRVPWFWYQRPIRGDARTLAGRPDCPEKLEDGKRRADFSVALSDSLWPLCCAFRF